MHEITHMLTNPWECGTILVNDGRMQSIRSLYRLHETAMKIDVFHTWGKIYPPPNWRIRMECCEQLKECNKTKRFQFYNLFAIVHNTIKILKSNICKDWFNTIYKLRCLLISNEMIYQHMYMYKISCSKSSHITILVVIVRTLKHGGLKYLS